MIKISGCADTVFEEAYFILKPGSVKNIMTERDLIIEANRIIKENSCKAEKRRGKVIKISPAMFFVLLFLSFSGFAAALAAILL